MAGDDADLEKAGRDIPEEGGDESGGGGGGGGSLRRRALLEAHFCSLYLSLTPNRE